MDTDRLENLCRTCASEEKNMTLINSSLIINDSVVLVSDLLGIFDVEIGNQFPCVICPSCIQKLVNAHEFKVQCEKSTVLFLNIIDKKIFNSDIYSHGSSVICNYNEDNFLNITPEKLLFKRDEEVKTNTQYYIVKDSASESCDTEPMISSEKKEIALDNKIDSCNCNEDNFLNNENIPEKLWFKTNNNVQKVTQYCISKNSASESCDIVPVNNSEEKEVFLDDNISSCMEDRTKNLKTIRQSTCNEQIDDVLFCSECKKSFTSKCTLIAHVKRHRNKGQFLCNVCGKGFSAHSCLLRHTRIHTGEKKYECQVCHKRFPSSNNLTLHSRRHTGIKPYLCMLCGKCFSHPTGLTYHLRTHTNEKPFACDVCGRRFRIQCHKDRHRKTHSGERPFACDMCDRAFIKKFDLQRHQDIHLGNKPYVCNICNKSFVRKIHRDYHVMVHTKERPHVCNKCGKGFIRRYYLMSHMKKHHPFDNDTVNEQNMSYE